MVITADVCLSLIIVVGVLSERRGKRIGNKIQNASAEEVSEIKLSELSS